MPKIFRIIIIVLILAIIAGLYVYGMSSAMPDKGDEPDKGNTPVETPDNGGDNSSDNSGASSNGEPPGGEPSGDAQAPDDPAGNEPEQPDTPAGKPYEVYEFDNLVEYDGIVEHIFFHPVIAYPELAFDGDSKEKGLDDWMVTVDEYVKILESLYEKDYILIDINTVWSEYVNDSGETRMKRNTLMIPEGKKPLVISYDDVNYNYYMLENGFTYKLIIGDDGEIWSWGLDPQGNEVISQDLDAVTILDKFVREHPDFSLNGAKGCLSITGYEGILGYRTNTDSNNKTPEFEANRLAECEAVKPIVKRLKETGWTFGCHTWGHMNLSTLGLNALKTDMTKWMDEVGSLVGETSILFYPFGGRADGDDVRQTGPMFKYLHELGFRVFASVGIESYSKIKSDISAVICDRLHPDGTTLRYSRERYLKFYDAKDIMDVSVRPDYGTSW